MQITADGLIIAQRKLDSGDDLLTILTAEYGIVIAFAKGRARQGRKAGGMATELLCYSHFVFFKNRDRYIVDAADSNRMFFKIRQDIVLLSLASYLAQFAKTLLPEGEPAEQQLKLMLNSLHLLESGRDPLIVKAVFELRMLSLCGYMPDLVGCQVCGRHDKEMLFEIESGCLICKDCVNSQNVVPLSNSVLTAMRHIIYSAENKMFAFELPKDALRYLNQITESYSIYRLDTRLSTLDFFYSIYI